MQAKFNWHSGNSLGGADTLLWATMQQFSLLKPKILLEYEEDEVVINTVIYHAQSNHTETAHWAGGASPAFRDSSRKENDCPDGMTVKAVWLLTLRGKP